MKTRAMLVLLVLAAPLAADDWPTALPPKELVLHLLERPVRVLDTRLAGCQAAVTWPPPIEVERGCPEGAMRDGETRFLQLQATWRDGAEVVPLGALGIVATLTAVGPTGQGHLLLYNPAPASGTYARPVASTLNFGPGQTVAAGATSALSQFQFQTPNVPFHPDLALYARVAGGGAVDVVLDVVGYYIERACP